MTKQMKNNKKVNNNNKQSKQKQLKGKLNTKNLRYRLILDPNGTGKTPEQP